MQIKEKKRFIGGGLNLDVEPSLLPPGDTIYRKNAVVDEEVGALVNMKGTRTLHAIGAGVPTIDPSETFTEIGKVEWMSDNSIIYFAVSSIGYDLIEKYSRTTSTKTVIYYGAGILDFDADHPITHANVVGGILYWTDGLNQPRKVNIDDAIARTVAMTAFTDEMFSAAQLVPWDSPDTIYGTDDSFEKNNLRGTQFQFCYRWIMEDNEVTSTSPISKIAIPLIDENDDSYVDDIKTNNFISVTLLTGSSLVKSIEVFARDGSVGDWTLVSRMNKSQYGIGDSGSYIYRFYNNSIPEGAVQDEINAINDNFPILADVQEVIDESIMAYGGVTEGFDPVATEIVLTPRREPVEFTPGTGAATRTFAVTEGYDSIRNYVELEILSGSPTNDLPAVNDVVEWDIRYIWDDEYGSYVERSTGSERVSAADVISIQAFLEFVGLNFHMPYEIIGDKIRLYTYLAAFSSWQFTDILLKVAGSTIQKSKRKGFKHGAIHPIGLVYFDKFRRNYGAITTPETDVFVPFYSASSYDGIVSSATAGTITVYGAGWTTNEFKGLWVQMTSGPRIGEIQEIRSHDASNIQLVGTFTGAPAAGNTFIIVSRSSREVAMIDWSIYHQPPIWAHYYSWVYAGNQTMTKWVQYITNGVTELPSAADSEYAKFSFIDIEPLNTHVSGSSVYIYPGSSVVPYEFTAGDRLRIITDSGKLGASYYTTPMNPLGNVVPQYVDVEIFGYKDSDPATNKLVISKIDISDLNLEAASLFLVEIYSPRKDIATRVFYETGDVFEIGDPETSNRYHKGQNQDQDPADPSNTPATGTIEDGDAYVYPRSFSYEIPTLTTASRVDVVESQHMSDLYDSNSYSQGKAFIELQNPQQKKYKFIRWSEKYFADTQVNGLSRFPSANRTKQFDDVYGEIYKIEQVGFTLRVLQARKPSTIYIGRNVLTTDSGDDSVTQSSDVLASIRPQVYDTGTVLPNSVVSIGNHTYFFDIYNGKMQRMADNGIQTISDIGLKQYFKDKAQALLTSGLANIDVIVGYDKKHDSLIVTFSDSITAANRETIIFYEPANRWITWADFKPHGYGNSGDKLYSFYNGYMYEHDYDSALRCKFYNVQYSFEEMLISNIHPDQIRVLDSIDLETNNNKYSSATQGWKVDSVITDPSDQYPNGQWSTIPAINFKPKQGRLYANFLRDKYTAGYPGTSYYLVNGRKLRGNLFYVLLKHTSTDKVILQSATVNSSLSYLS